MSKQIKKDELVGQIKLEVEADNRLTLPGDTELYYRAFLKFLDICAQVAQKYYLKRKILKNQQEAATGVDLSCKSAEELENIRRTDEVFSRYYWSDLERLQGALNRDRDEAQKIAIELRTCAKTAGVPFSQEAKVALFYDMVQLSGLRDDFRTLINAELTKPAEERRTLSLEDLSSGVADLMLQRKQQEVKAAKQSKRAKQSKQPWTDRHHIEGHPYSDTEYPYGHLLTAPPDFPGVPESDYHL